MIINSTKNYLIAEQTGLSFSVELTPLDFSKNIISLKEFNNFNFTLVSGKFSDPNNNATYFYNIGENLTLSGNINNTSYDYYINNNPICLSGQKQNFIISGIAFSGSNLNVDNFQIFGNIPNYEIKINDTFVFGKALNGWIKNYNADGLKFRVLSGSFFTPTGFTFGSIPNTIINSGYIGIDPNLGGQFSEIPISYGINLNLLTDFGLINKIFTVTGVPGSFLDFFLSINPNFFVLDSYNPYITYTINSLFSSGSIEQDKIVDIKLTYLSGITGEVLENVTVFGSGYNIINFNQLVTGTGLFTPTGIGILSGYYNGNLITGLGIGTGYVETGITGGNFRKNILITGTGIYNAQVFNLNTYVISGYRENILGSGYVVYFGNLTGYISGLTGSGTYNFYSGFNSILNSQAPLAILRKNEFFTGILNYGLGQTGTVAVTGFNTTYLDYSGYSTGISLTGLLEGSGYIYSSSQNFNTTGILRSEINNRKITGILNTQIVDYVLNTGTNIAKIVTIVSGEATGNYLNNPNIFGISILGTGLNVITGSNTIFGTGLITGFNTGYIIKDNYIVTGLVSGIVFYQATGDSNNPSNPNNFVQALYVTNITGSKLYSNFSLDNSIAFTGVSIAPIMYTGYINFFGPLYSQLINLSGINTVIYNNPSGIRTTGYFYATNNGILTKNTHFTGISNYQALIPSTGISSGANDTFYYWEETATASNLTFTGIIYSGSGNLITTPFTYVSNTSTSGLLSGQVGTGVNYLTIAPAVLNPQITQINNIFYTGIKNDIFNIVVSGIATGQKNNFVGLNVTGSGYISVYGSGFLTGSGYINVAGYGQLTGTDGTLVTQNITGITYVELTGNPSNINDPINIVYVNQILQSTGTGFFNIFNNKNITGRTSNPILLSGIYTLTGSGIVRLTGNNSYGSGSNLFNGTKYTVFSGILNEPTGSATIYFTGISNQFISPNPFYAVATGLNTTTGSNIIVTLNSPVTLSGYVTGVGTIFNNLQTGFSGTLPASIDPLQDYYFTGVNFIFSESQSATGYFLITGSFNNFTGNYTGMIAMPPGYVPYFDYTTNIINSRNFINANLTAQEYYDSFSATDITKGISGANILYISGKQNIFVYGNYGNLYTGTNSGIFSTSKYYVLPYQVNGSGTLTGLYEILTGIIQFKDNESSINKIIYKSDNPYSGYVIFVGNFKEYLDVKNASFETTTKGAIAVNLTGGFISNWYVDPDNNTNNSIVKDVVVVDNNKILLGGSFESILGEYRNNFAMVDFRGDGAFPDNDTNLSGLNLNLKDGSVNSIIYNPDENEKFYVVGSFNGTQRTGEELASENFSANTNFYARPKTSYKINPFWLKSNFTGKFDVSDIFYKDYIGLDDYGYTVDFENPTSEDGPSNKYITKYQEINNNYYFYGKFNNVGSRHRRGFAAFDSTSGFIKNANVNIEGKAECLNISGNSIFIGGNIKSYGGIPYNFGGDDIDQTMAGYGIKNQLTIDRTFIPIQPWASNYAIYDIKEYNNKVYVVGDFDFIRMPTGNYTDTSTMNRRSSFAVFDLSGNLLPEVLHFTQYGGNYVNYGGYDVRTLFITGSTGYFGGNFECVVGSGVESNLPTNTTIRYSGFRTAAFNLNTLHPITGYTGHFDGTVYQINHFTGNYLIAVGNFESYYRPYSNFYFPIHGACVLDRFNGTGIFKSGACPTITGGYFRTDYYSSYNDIRGYYRRSDGHYYLYGRLLDPNNNNYGIALFNGSETNTTTTSEFRSVIAPNNPATGFRFYIEKDGSFQDRFVNSVLENGTDLLVGGLFNMVSGGRDFSPLANATGLVIINRTSGFLVNTGLNLGLLRGNGLDENWDEVFDIKKYNNKFYVGGRFRHFKADGENSSSGIAAGKFAVFNSNYDIERSLNCNTYDADSYIYKIYSGNNRAYLVGRNFGNGDNNYYNSSYSFSVQSPKYWDYINNNNGKPIGLIELNRSGYDIPLTPINLTGICLGGIGEKINVIAKYSTGLFLGGNFTSINGIPRTGLAWIDYDATIKDWSPQLEPNFGQNVEIKDMFISGDSLIFVGNFFQINTLNRAGAAQVKITGLGQSIDEVSNFNLNSSYGFSDYFVNAIYNDDSTTGYYIGGNFPQGLVKVDKNTLSLSTFTIDISGLNTSGIRTINKVGNNYYIGGDFLGINGNYNSKNLAVFQLSSGSIYKTFSIPQLSTSDVSDIQINDTDIYVVSNNSSRSYKFNLEELDQRLTINNSWTPYFSKYSSNDSNYNTNYLMPSRASKIFITGKDVYIVGDFHNVSYARNNIFATNKSGILLSGITAEFISDVDSNIDIDVSTEITALDYDTGTNNLIIGGKFQSVNNSSASNFCQINLLNNKINVPYVHFNNSSYISDVKKYNLNNMNALIFGNFQNDLEMFVTGGGYMSTGGFTTGSVFITGISTIGTGLLLIENPYGVYNGPLNFSGSFPNSIYTGVSGYAFNSTGLIYISPFPYTGDSINIKISTGAQYSINSTILLNQNGENFIYGTTLQEENNQFSNLNELYYLMTGLTVLPNYININLNLPSSRIELVPKLSGESGSSGTFNLTQIGNSFTLQNFSGGKNYTYTTNIYPSPNIGNSTFDISFTGTGYYEKIIETGTYTQQNVVLTTTGLWRATGYYVYNSGMIFENTNLGVRVINGYDIPTRNITITGWGLNTSGCTTGAVNLNPFDIRYIFAGSNFSIAQLNNGTITGWGDNTYNQLLAGTGLTGIQQLSVGSTHVLALLNDNTITGWGNNSFERTTGINGSALSLTGVKQVSAGGFHGLAILDNDTITGWGQNSSYQTTGINGSALTLTGIKQISAGAAHSLALFYDGRVTGWGSNTNGRALGGNNLTDVKKVLAGSTYSIALLNNGKVTGWGQNVSFRALGGTGLTEVIDIALGSNGSHTIALLSNYKITGWGVQANERITGLNNSALNLTNIYQIAAGTSHSLGLYKYNTRNDLNFHTTLGTGDVLKLYQDGMITGIINKSFIGSGLTTGYTLNYGVGLFLESSGILEYNAIKTGFNPYVITGSYLDYNANYNITGNIDFIYNILYTGATLITDINSTSYVGRVIRTGFVNLNSNKLVSGSFESTKYFISTGFIQYNSGVLFTASDQGIKVITGFLTTGSGLVNLPTGIYPISNQFSGGYSFISTGTGSMIFTGLYKRGGIARVTGENNFLTSGYSINTGSVTINTGDFGIKYLNIYFTGLPSTGTLLPLNTLNKNAWSIKSGFNHIGNNLVTITGSGNMTGYFSEAFSFNKRFDISGNLEYIATFTGISSGLVTGFIKTGITNISNAQTNNYTTLPYNINSYFPIIKNLADYIMVNNNNKILNEIFDPKQFGYNSYDSITIDEGGSGVSYQTFYAIDPLAFGYNIWTRDFVTDEGNYIIPKNSLFEFSCGLQEIPVGDGAAVLDYNQYNLTRNISFPQTFLRTGIFNFTGNANTTGLYVSKTNFLITGLATGYFPITGTGIVNLTGVVILNKNQTLFINYPYPSGDGIAYLTLTGITNFSGNFISGVKITGLYNKNYIGLFGGSISGSYTGTWSGSGLFTGYQQITYSGLDSGKKSVNLNQLLINSGLESGLAPTYTLGLYSGLKTIQNLNYNQTLIITGSGYMEKIISGFALAGVTSGSGLALVTGYLSGLLNKNYTGSINYETGILLTGLSVNGNFALTGLYTGTVQLTGIINKNLNLFISGITSGAYLNTKTFTGSFDVYTGTTLTGTFIKINPTSSGYYINRLVPTGENIYLKINFNENIDYITGNLMVRVYTGSLTGSVINNTIYGTRII